MGIKGDFAKVDWNSDAMQDQFISAMINGVPALNAAYGRYQQSRKYFMGGVNEYPFTPEFISEDAGKENIREAFPKIKDACIELSKEVKLADGYSIVLENRFAYEEYETFFGLFLTVFDSKKVVEPYSKRSDLLSEELHNCTVGVLGFKVGFPFVIHTIQGNNDGKAPWEFYQKTGKTFDDVLLKRMIDVVGCTMSFDSNCPLRKIPRIAFKFYELPSEKMKNRLLQLVPRKYSSRAYSKYFWAVKKPEVYVRNCFLARAHRVQNSPAKAPIKI